jgi:hypothetical protein
MATMRQCRFFLFFVLVFEERKPGKEPKEDVLTRPTADGLEPSRAKHIA